MLFVPRFVFVVFPFVPRFMLPVLVPPVDVLPVDVFPVVVFTFDIGVGEDVITAVFVFRFDIFEFVFMLRPLALLLAFPAVSPQPETTNAIEQTIAARGPVSLLIRFLLDV